jgi:hypothetical protein
MKTTKLGQIPNTKLNNFPEGRRGTRTHTHTLAHTHIHTHTHTHTMTIKICSFFKKKKNTVRIVLITTRADGSIRPPHQLRERCDQGVRGVVFRKGIDLTRKQDCKYHHGNQTIEKNSACPKGHDLNHDLVAYIFTQENLGAQRHEKAGPNFKNSHHY